ncbi:MAG: FAD/NAD(P)-binding oxidoreductase, partial [Thermoguttaceae bacterium]
MRQVAGLGRINPANKCTPTPKDYDFCDLLIVGAGPTGMAAAITAAEKGLDVLLVDEQPTPGGSLAWQAAHDSAAQDQCQARLKKIASLDNLRFRGSTQAGGWYTDHWVALIDSERLTKLRARAMLVASGCFEQPAVFQNNDLPGVMLGSAAQRLMHLYAVKPVDRAVVLAANSEGYRVALDLVAAGVEVAAVVDPRPEGEPSQLAQRALDANITIHKGHTVYEAVPAGGKTRIRGAVVCPLDDGGLPVSDAKKYFDCDGIVVSVGWTPNGGLIYQAGGRFHHADDIQQIVPYKLPGGLFAAGRVNGV